MPKEIALLRRRLIRHHVTLQDLEGFFSQKIGSWDWALEDPWRRLLTLVAVSKILETRGSGLQTDLEDFTHD